MTLGKLFEQVIRPNARVRICNIHEQTFYEGTAEETPARYKEYEVVEVTGLGVLYDELSITLKF